MRTFMAIKTLLISEAKLSCFKISKVVASYFSNNAWQCKKYIICHPLRGIYQKINLHKKTDENFPQILYC